MKIDELNVISETTLSKANRKAIPIAEYFREMEIPEDEKDKRIELAYKIYNVLVLTFTLLDAADATGTEVDRDYYVNLIVRKLEDTYEQTFESDKYADRLNEFAEVIVDTTLKNIADKYYLSEDRATLDAENEANWVSSDFYYQQAIKSGCTKKRWLTMRDNRVRHTHKEVDGEEQAIDKPFQVGMSQMLFPCDMSYGASLVEIVNCRCSCEYY